MHLRLSITALAFIFLAMDPILASALEPSPQTTPETSALGNNQHDPYAQLSLVDELLNEMDHQHRSLSEQIVNFTEEIDTFFISDDLESRVNYSHIQLGYRYTRYKDDSYQLDPVFNAHIHLPRTQNRLTLEVSNNNPFASVNDTATDTSAGNTNPTDPSEIDHALNVSLGYAREIYELFNTKLTGGARLAGDKMRLFINLQLYREFFFERWSLRLSEDLYRDNIVFSRATTQMLFERKIDDEQLFRSITKNIYYKDLGYSQNHQTFYVLNQLSKRDAIIYELGSMWEKQNDLLDYNLENYYAMIRYSRLVYRDWLFIEVSPQVHYLRSEDFHPKPLLALQFTAFIGNNK